MSNLSTANHFNPEQTRLIKRTIMSGKTEPTDNDLALFGLICQRTGLDPFSKQIYAIERSGKWTFQISIDGLRAIADRTGTYAGSDEPLYDEGIDLYQFEMEGRKLPTVCKVTVWKIVQGIRCPFTGVARFSEFEQKPYANGKPGLWQEKPCHMMAVRAESQALRKAFPQVAQVEEYTGSSAPSYVTEAQWEPVSGAETPRQYLIRRLTDEGVDPSANADKIKQLITATGKASAEELEPHETETIVSQLKG